MSDGSAPKSDSYRQRSIRGVSLALTGFGLTQALNFLAYAILARLASPDDFGLFAAGAVISGVAMLFAESGMLAALITRRDRLEEAANTALVWTTAAGFGLVLLSLALSPVIAWVLGDSRITLVSAALSGVLLLRALSVVPDALLQRRLSFVRRLVVEPLGVVAFASVAIATTDAGAGVWGLVLGTYASMTTKTVAPWAFARWRPRPRLASMEMWRELVGFARPVVLSEVVRRLVSQLDVLVIGRFVGLSALGQYAYAMRLAIQPHNAWVGVGAYVLLPIFARLADDERRLKSAFLRALRWMAIGVFPLSLMLVAMGYPAAILIFGEQWRPAGWAVMALAGFPVGQAIISIASELFKAAGHPRELPKVHAMVGVLTAASMFAMLPFGLLGVAGGVSLGALLAAGYTIHRMQAALGVPARSVLSELAPPLVCSAIMGGAGYAVNALALHPEERSIQVGVVMLVAEGLGLLVLYVLVLTVLSPQRGRAIIEAGRGLVQRLARRGDASAPTGGS